MPEGQKPPCLPKTDVEQSYFGWSSHFLHRIQRPPCMLRLGPRWSSLRRSCAKALKATLLPTHSSRGWRGWPSVSGYGLDTTTRNLLKVSLWSQTRLILQSTMSQAPEELGWAELYWYNNKKKLDQSRCVCFRHGCHALCCHRAVTVQWAVAHNRSELLWLCTDSCPAPSLQRHARVPQTSPGCSELLTTVCPTSLGMPAWPGRVSEVRIPLLHFHTLHLEDTPLTEWTW